MPVFENESKNNAGVINVSRYNASFKSESKNDKLHNV